MTKRTFEEACYNLFCYYMFSYYTTKERKRNSSRAELPAPGPWTGTGPRPVRNRATQQEVSSRWCQNHPSPPAVHGKTVFHKNGPWLPKRLGTTVGENSPWAKPSGEIFITWINVSETKFRQMNFRWFFGGLKPKQNYITIIISKVFLDSTMHGWMLSQ